MPTQRRDLNGSAHRQRRLLAIANSGGICCLCGQPMRLDLPGTHPEGPTLEHLIPVSLGGSPTHPNNLSASHHRCNSRRQNLTIEQYRARYHGTQTTDPRFSY